AFATGYEFRLDLLPRALDTPLGWYRAVRTVPGLYSLVVLVSFGLFLFFGWLVVRVARPKTTASTIGFAAAVAAVASICHVMFAAPVMMEQAREEVADGKNRIHPVGDSDPDRGWLADVKRPGTDAHAEAEHLRQFLPPEKRNLDYDGWETDLRRLRRQAAS